MAEHNRRQSVRCGEKRSRMDFTGTFLPMASMERKRDGPDKQRASKKHKTGRSSRAKAPAGPKPSLASASSEPPAEFEEQQLPIEKPVISETQGTAPGKSAHRGRFDTSQDSTTIDSLPVVANESLRSADSELSEPGDDISEDEEAAHRHEFSKYREQLPVALEPQQAIDISSRLQEGVAIADEAVEGDISSTQESAESSLQPGAFIPAATPTMPVSDPAPRNDQLVKLRHPQQRAEEHGSEGPHTAQMQPSTPAAVAQQANGADPVTGARRSGRARKLPLLYGRTTQTPVDEEFDDTQVASDTTESGLFQPVSRAKKMSRRKSSRAQASTISGPFQASSRRPPTTEPVTPLPAPREKKGSIAPYPTPPSTQDSENESSVAIEIDPDLLKLSRTLTHRKPIGEKDGPRGQPRVWADSRQALCETVPYFKKPQGGCHSNDRHVYAFLFDGVGHCREYMDSDVIIARAGGGMESDSTGSMVQGRDQSMTEAQVQAVMNDVALQNPLIIICGNKNVRALCQMPHRLNVLGWYKPLEVWAERTAGKGKKSWTTIKYRFERLSGNGEPAWYAPEAAETSVVHDSRPLFTKVCSECEQIHPQVYLESWLCLTSTCARFWKLDSGQDASCGKLEYNPAYLLKRTLWDIEIEPFDVRPSLPNIGKTIGDNLTYINTRGVCCPDCGRCNQRYKFKGWHCDSPSCNWELPVQHQVVLPASLHSPWDSLGEGPSLGRNKHERSVKAEIRYTHQYKVYRYTFTGVKGCLIHAVANSRVNQREEDGPDAMLAEIQTVDMGLERRRFGGEKMAAETAPRTPQRRTDGQTLALTVPAEDTPTLEASGNVMAKEGYFRVPTQKTEVEEGDFMTAFSMNYGMPYKFVASGASQPFEKAPWPVRACRSRLNWAAKELLGDPSTTTDFNEELVFAYMEGQKIEYHDDGEEGLGPRIATLSLGGKAKMHMRMKAKHFVGCSKTGLLTGDEPIPGSMEFEKRHRHWQELQELKDTDRAAFQRRIKEIPKELGIYERRNKKAEDLVTVTLSHGDIVLMDGYDIQKFLEHKVVPEGYLRFALTCRTVLEHHLKEHERPLYEVKADDYGYDGSRLL